MNGAKLFSTGYRLSMVNYQLTTDRTFKVVVCLFDVPIDSSQFLCNADDKLSILYNDLSVLESHHAALTFKLTLSDDNVNIFKVSCRKKYNDYAFKYLKREENEIAARLILQHLERDTYKQLRQSVIDMILATEMTKHFEHLAKFMNVCSIRPADTPRADVMITLFSEVCQFCFLIWIYCVNVIGFIRKSCYKIISA